MLRESSCFDLFAIFADAVRGSSKRLGRAVLEEAQAETWLAFCNENRAQHHEQQRGSAGVKKARPSWLRAVHRQVVQKEGAMVNKRRGNKQGGKGAVLDMGVVSAGFSSRLMDVDVQVKLYYCTNLSLASAAQR